MVKTLWEVTFQKDDPENSYNHKHKEVHIFANGIVEAANKAENYRARTLPNDWYTSVVMLMGPAELLE